MATKSEIAVIGHFALDTILLPSRSMPFHVLGGATTYTSFAAKRLDATVSVISKVGENFPKAYLWWLNQEGIDVSCVIRKEKEECTYFELSYSKDFSKRKLKLKSKATPINLEDLPVDLHVKAVHIAPIDNEISYEIVEKMKGSAEILSLDPQGMLRTFDKAGNVKNKQKINRKILGLINIYRSSKEELFYLTRKKELKKSIKMLHDHGIETAIVTNGAKGSVLSIEGAQYNIGVCPSKVIVDPTGAGDVFIGAFLSEYLQQKESLWCACVGSAAASTVVEGLGPTYFGSKQEIYQRATVLYEKQIKQ
jgi:sugar/nucleoside kinase (ribokinase family)